MTPAVILEIIVGVLQFPNQLLSLIRILKSTPAEDQQAVLKTMQDAAHNFQSTGRPTWP